MKEAPKNYPGLVFQETFRNEQTVRRNSGVPNNVIFENGVGSFDGSTSSIHYSSKINPNNNFSIRCRIRFLDVTDRGGVSQYSSGAKGFYLGLGADGKVAFSVQGLSGGSTSSSQVNPNIEYDVVGTFDASTGKTTLYVDGIETDNASNSVGFVEIADLYIGNRRPTEYQKCNIDLVELYNRVLTAEEVANLYNNKWNKELVNNGDLGNNLVVNGGFDTDSDWSLTETWVISDGVASATANGSSQYLQQDFSVINGEKYLFSYEILQNDLNGNGASLSASGAFAPSSLSTEIGKHSTEIVVQNQTASCALKIGVSGTCSTGGLIIDNVIVQKLNPKTLIDFDSSNGVIRDRQVGSIVGDSVVVDGNPFVDGSWYKQTGWTITNGKAIANMTSGTGSIYQLNKLIIGKKYKIIYKISNYVSGSGRVLLGSGSGRGNLNSGNGTYTETLIATWDDIYFEAASGSEFSLDFLIITEVRDDLSPTDVEVTKEGALFNGSTSLIDTGSDFIGTKPITILCWSKRYSRGEKNEGRWLNNGKLIMRNTSGANNFYVFSSNGFTFATSKIDSLILNKFQFVAITRNVNGETNFYIGTKEEAPTMQNSSATDSGTPVAGSYNVIIGNNNGGSRTFDGLIPKLKVVEGILDLDKITQYWSETRKEIK